MLPEEDVVRLQHMLEAATEAISYGAGRTRADLDTDRPLMHSLVRCLEIVGEAANQVSDETRSLCPSVPWAVMVAMRNRLIHAYFDINLDIVWTTVQDDVPALVDELRVLLGGGDPETEPG